jgi:FAD/FMN-containing dehydrogenase
MVWRVRHDRQESGRLGSRISAIILKAELGSGAIEGMQALKQALDPQNIFNPGKLLPAVQGLYS